MSLARALFVFALFTPVLSATGSKFMVSTILGQSPQTVVAPGAPVAAALPARAMVSIATPTHATPSPTPGVTASPTSSATSATVTLTRYWLGQTSAHPGDTLSVGYAISNGTGQQAQLTLGISMKPSSAPSWTSGFADPSHDVTAIVAVGNSTHKRYFTLPTSLAPGSYDVAWGLRDASGAQVAVVSTTEALQVVK
jgi:hypothetical protein